jgi:hypothetical protein
MSGSTRGGALAGPWRDDGDERQAVVETAARFDLLKLSHEELASIVGGPTRLVRRLTEEIRGLQARGARNVVIWRAEQPALASIDADLLELHDRASSRSTIRARATQWWPRWPSAPSGASPSRRCSRLAVAAGALNVTRRGLGPGERQDRATGRRRVDTQAGRGQRRAFRQLRVRPPASSPHGSRATRESQRAGGVHVRAEVEVNENESARGEPSAEEY